MQPPKITNLTELNSYLASLERTIMELEAQNETLQHKVESLEDARQLTSNTPTVSISKDDVFLAMNKMLPNSGLFSHNFIHRALAIWGHYFVAQLIIVLTLGGCYFGFVLFLALVRYFGI